MLNSQKNPTTEKSLSVAACFEIVLEHQKAIVLLTENEYYGSASTLTRSVSEAYVRGIWLRDCATEEQWKKYRDDDFRIPFRKLVADIEKLDEYACGVLSETTSSNWKLLNSLTHTGWSQVSQRWSEEYIEPNYSEEDIIKILKFVSSYALLASLEIVRMSKEQPESVEHEFLKKMEEYSDATRTEQASHR